MYLGGAHGTLGVLYIIVQACLMDPLILQEKQDGFELIKATYEDLLGQQTNEGGFPFVRSDGLRNNDVVNHWCHGAPGAIGPLLAGV